MGIFCLTVSAIPQKLERLFNFRKKTHSKKLKTTYISKQNENNDSTDLYHIQLIMSEVEREQVKKANQERLNKIDSIYYEAKDHKDNELHVYNQ